MFERMIGFIIIVAVLSELLPIAIALICTLHICRTESAKKSARTNGSRSQAKPGRDVVALTGMAPRTGGSGDRTRLASEWNKLQAVQHRLFVKNYALKKEGVHINPKKKYKYNKKNNIYIFKEENKMKNMNKMIAMLLAVLMLASLTNGLALPAGALSVVTGEIEKPICAEGADLTWSLDENGVLTISGTGDMVYSNSSGNMPWSRNPEQIRELVVGEGVTSLSGYAFYRCVNLRKITLPDSLREIGYACFQGCAALQAAVIPKNCETIGNCAFSGCTSLASLTSRSPAFPVVNGVLYNREKTQLITTAANLTGSFEIPASVTELYSGLTNLKLVDEMVLPDGLGVEAYDFSDCTGLRAFRVSGTNNRYSVTDGVLYNKSGDTLIAYPCGKPGPYVFPENVTSIGKSAFAGVQTLDELTVPETVTSIGGAAFRDAPKLRSVTVLGKIKTLNTSTFANDTALTEVHLPEGMVRIDSGCFSGCVALTKFDVPDGVTAVESSAFEYCSALREVTFPATLTKIGTCCFLGCASLEIAHFLGAEPEASYSCLHDRNDLVIHAEGWDVETLSNAPVVNCTFTDAGDGTVRCSCGAALNVRRSHIHTYGEWTLEDGAYIRACTLCGETETMDGPASSGEALASSNVNAQNYTVWSAPVRSYLLRDGDGMTRVEYADGRLVRESYDAGGNFLDGETLPMELPRFGGFYEGDEYYFLVYGQNNPDERNDVEVLRVVRYDKDWNRLDQASLFGANTYAPFDAGSLRMVQAGDMLYIHTCHKMYAYWNVNHQANMTLALNIPTMKITQCRSGISGIYSGYVSHSFNQFILADGADLLTLDQWEAGEDDRTTVMVRYRGSAGTQTLDDAPEYLTFFRYPGTGNSTGTGLGGFENTEGYYLIIGSAVHPLSGDTYGQRNIFVISVPKDISSEDEAPNPLWLTGHAEDDDVAVSTPQTVRLDDGRVAVLWTENGVVTCTCLSADGTRLTEPGRLPDAKLSDCRPVQVGSEIVWYATSGGTPVFYRLSTADMRTLTVVDTNPADPEPDPEPEPQPQPDPEPEPEPDPQKPAFSDVEDGKWYADAVAWAVSEGITKGTSDTAFSPDAPCTRAQVVTFLWRAAGCPEPTTDDNPFADVKAGAYYSKAVLWALDRHITTGIDATHFSPDAPCTRAQVVTFLARYMIQHHGGDFEMPFVDVPVSAYYYFPVCWAYQQKITTGTDATHFSPDAPCTRAQVVTFLYRVASV